MSKRAGGGLFQVTLIVEARDKNGKLVDRRVKEADLILDNFKNLIAYLFYPEETISAGWRRRISLVNMAGTSTALNVRSTRDVVSGYGTCWQTVRQASMKVGTRLRIGTGTVAPTRGDYKLGAEVASAVPSITIGADYIEWKVAILLTVAYDISEAGLSTRAQLSDNATPAYDNFLLFRDTFTPISVPADGSISVIYKLTM